MQWSVSPCGNIHACGPKDRWAPYPCLLDKHGAPFKPVYNMARTEHNKLVALGPLLYAALVPRHFCRLNAHFLVFGCSPSQMCSSIQLSKNIGNVVHTDAVVLNNGEQAIAYEPVSSPPGAFSHDPNCAV